MTRRRFGRLGLAAGAALMLGTRRVRALEIEDGDGLITVTLGNRPVEIFTYKPPGFDPERSPLLIVLHGVGRDAEGYRDFARPIADAAQALVAAPRFDLRRFGHHAYQWAGIARLAGRTDTGYEVEPRRRDTWLTGRIRQLADALREAEDADLPLYVIGHSAGAQFVNKIAAFDDIGARRLVAANPSSYVWPSQERPFPYGFGNLPDELGDGAAICRYLSAPLTLYLGTADTLDGDTIPMRNELDKLPEAEEQGTDRYHRGLNVFAAARAAAVALDVPFGWKLVEAPGVNHDAGAMFARRDAVTALFG